MRGGPLGGVLNLAASRGDCLSDLCRTAPSSSAHTTSLPAASSLLLLSTLVPVLGRFMACLSSRMRLSSRRSRRRKRRKTPASAKRAVPTMETTMAMIICDSE